VDVTCEWRLRIILHQYSGGAAARAKADLACTTTTTRQP
jgi:hypothetical protein